jgi:anti-sigma regulatory factor (Ser/Thr protein kinase)
MWLRIIDIDLDASRVDLEVAPDRSEDCFTRLDAFVSRCATEGISDVRLFYRRGTSKRNVSRLKDFAAMKRFGPPNPSLSRRDGGDGDYGCFHSERPREKRRTQAPRQPARYTIGVNDIKRGVERLHTMIALLCASENLDPRSTLQLRLCVYELVTNSIEHGRFTAKTPAICLEILFGDDRVSVNYKDNADAFMTIAAVNVDLVEARIRQRSNRGLGLYMLNKICSDFEYDRSGEWNVTSFSLTMKRERETVTKR